ncbi:hypothetical protein AAE02nite_05430 [Adhaeribacter aerolatus]|uniref:SusD/RagB family nutrient-binding outer membrane lipoprotein n=1 Tax=Adhaeribacter aerolatus TaxID=670289 RepID=A0A512AT35_9BACT|nr:SusD/RagB family nutrient-binding outer membrane lipoprotein [Adhaeribacter aerolatus]GEO02879.1 hypothetical protein AAE02nite_05430 [Adhaeribacter aerolatus]
MKKKYIYPALACLLLGVSSCDKDFEEINTNPIQATALDPIYLFSNAQFGSALQTNNYEGEIVQQIITPFTGVVEGGNHNVVIEANANATFNALYQGPIRNLIDVIAKTKDNPERSNLYNMARIWKAYDFMVLVDTYGDVPYFEAGKGFLESTYLPKYDDQKAIYEDILKELEDATNKLDASKDKVTGDLFYGGDIPKWKKLGNSLLLRAGMRYTELEPAAGGKADQLVDKALDPARGGVLASNDDNALLRFTATYTNATSNQLTATERQNFFVGKPFVDFLKTNNDPRLPYIAVRYSNSSTPAGGTMNADPAAQVGMPYGYSDVTLVNAPGYPGKENGTFAYSQFRRNTVLKLEAPEYFVTHAQTQLLLAEAAKRGYIAGGDAAAATYYENGIRAHLNQMKDYDATIINITPEQQQAYLLQPGVAYNSGTALKQINEQYWVASFRSWSEAWANFRRSGYPQLAPINYPGEDPSVKTQSAGGFIRRLPYPAREKSVNSANVAEATTRMGGDNLGVRVFWDKQ